MRKIVFLFLIVFSFSCEQPSTFTGYLVGKEYTPEHMSDKYARTYDFNIYVPINPTIHSNRSKPYLVEENYTWYIANKEALKKFRVSKKLFNSKVCGAKVTMTY